MEQYQVRKSFARGFMFGFMREIGCSHRGHPDDAMSLVYNVEQAAIINNPCTK